jgi:hypothetical protein
VLLTSRRDAPPNHILTAKILENALRLGKPVICDAELGIKLVTIEHQFTLPNQSFAMAVQSLGKSYVGTQCFVTASVSQTVSLFNIV